MKDKYKETIEVYEVLGKGYLKDVEKVVPPAFSDFVKLIPKKGLVLDVGCAGGRDSKRLAQRDFRVIGIDLVDEFLREARKDVPGAEFKKMDLLELKFPKDYFDAIFANAVLLHIKKKDILEALKGFYRVLKPGGKLYIVVKKGKGSGYKKEKLSGGKRRFFSYFLEDELKKLVEKAGLKVISIKIFPDELGRKDVNWIGIFASKKRKLSKNLKEAEERFKKGCENKDHEEIASASAEILIYDKKHSDVLVYSIMFGFPVLEKIKADGIDISKLNSRQIRSFVVREWEVFKDKRRKQKDKLKLSEEQEKRVISTVAHALREIKKENKKS